MTYIKIIHVYGLPVLRLRRRLAGVPLAAEHRAGYRWKELVETLRTSRGTLRWDRLARRYSLSRLILTLEARKWHIWSLPGGRNRLQPSRAA